MKRCWLSWSSGKDSAWALHCLRQNGQVRVEGLVTTLNEEFNRVAMHAVREELLQAQASAAGLPLHIVPLPWPCSNDLYEARMADLCRTARTAGIQVIAFGDLFLEEVRRYRVDRMRGTGLEPMFPLWKAETGSLARTMISSGLRAKITCVDPKQLDESFTGREFDLELLSSLPPSVDPCGERGEFHSFVYEGPMFERSLKISVGAAVRRDGFVFADLLLDRPGSSPGGTEG